MSPRPGEEVVEVRRRLAVRNGVHHPAEALAHERDRDELVEPEALTIERREAQHSRERGQRSDRYSNGRRSTKNGRRCGRPFAALAARSAAPATRSFAP